MYLLLSPSFSDLSISVSGNKTLKITATGLDDGPYVQSVMLNGLQWNKSWITHDDLIGGEGGTIEFVLGSEQKEWDTGELPPSPGHVNLGSRN